MKSILVISLLLAITFCQKSKSHNHKSAVSSQLKKKLTNRRLKKKGGDECGGLDYMNEQLSEEIKEVETLKQGLEAQIKGRIEKETNDVKLILENQQTVALQSVDDMLVTRLAGVEKEIDAVGDDIKDLKEIKTDLN